MTGGSDGDIHLWNPHTARLIKTYPGHARSVLSLALFASHTHLHNCYNCCCDTPLATTHSTRDSSTLASSGDDTQPCLWDIATGTQTRRLRGHLSVCAILSPRARSALSSHPPRTRAHQRSE